MEKASLNHIFHDYNVAYLDVTTEHSEIQIPIYKLIGHYFLFYIITLITDFLLMAK